jgi:ATPase subunit of ABC transporter with duplicated ATPase domains
VHLVARSLSFNHGPVPILRDVSVDVAIGDRIGIVGPNGAGKSTLLRLLAGELAAAAGRVERHPSGAQVALLHQEVRGEPGETVRDYLARRIGVTAAEHELDASTADLAAGAAGADDRYSAALERWLAVGAADFDARLGAELDRVGLGADRASDLVERLSGGQKSRVDLAAVLLHRAPVLLLDEPTNDLDVTGLALLEEAVLRPELGLVVVSHDRAFLERVVTEVLELDEHTHGATRYAGGWAGYQHDRTADRERAERAHLEYTNERDRLAAQARRQRQWSERGVRNAVRKPADNDKNIRHAHIARAERRAGDARRTDDRLARLERVDKPWEPWRLQLRLADHARSGDVVLEARRAVARRGSFTLGPVDLEVHFGDRIQLVGLNGAGKSTLLDLLLGRLAPDGGAVRRGASVVIGELGQQRDELEGSDVLSAVVDVTGATAQEARSMLAKLGLGPEHVGRAPGSLSAGERTRAVLGTFQLRGVNLLVLDEPTNHLDLPAIEQLEVTLEHYRGTLLVVSHDRRFLEALGLDRTWEVVSGTVHAAG